jgi:hypothetical protein
MVVDTKAIISLGASGSFPEGVTIVRALTLKLELRCAVTVDSVRMPVAEANGCNN